VRLVEMLAGATREETMTDRIPPAIEAWLGPKRIQKLAELGARWGLSAAEVWWEKRAWVCDTDRRHRTLHRWLVAKYGPGLSQAPTTA
jgi:hypothetical protein